MKQTKIVKKYTTKKQKEEVTKILAHFFKESSAIVDEAIKESHRKHPSLFKSS